MNNQLPQNPRNSTKTTYSFNSQQLTVSQQVSTLARKTSQSLSFFVAPIKKMSLHNGASQICFLKSIEKQTHHKHTMNKTA